MSVDDTERDLWREADAVFERLLELPADERVAALGGMGLPDALAERVRALLAADDRTAGPLDRGWRDHFQGAVDRSDADPLAGRTLRVFRLVERIGRGGMSVVYRAERCDGPFEHEVAVKLLYVRQVGSGDAMRFVREQRILARLRHPNIASLFDGGFAEDGTPYLVMELIEGERIDEYCDRRSLGIEQRIELVRQVCHAVGYAHRQLVVHRDIKPGNVLVTVDGQVKLLDFGIAKLLVEEESELTRTGAQPLTPEFAAPEQLVGGTVTTATDVYALGVLLYRLLTGSAPFTAETRLREPNAVPSAPSRAATDVGRRQAHDQARPHRRIDADLDRIVLMALRPEPERRYPGAEELGRDLERWRAGQPVAATPDSLRYRLRKFVGRNRAAVAAAAIGCSMLAGLTAVYLARVGQERDRAQVEAARAGEVTDFLLNLFAAGNPVESLGEPLTAAGLLERGIAWTDALEDQPAVQAQILSTIAQAYYGLGHIEAARELWHRAAVIRREHFGTAVHPDVAHSIAHVAWTHLVQEDFPAAETLFEEALEIIRQTLGPADLEYANSLAGLAHSLNGQGRSTEAEAHLHRVLEIRRAAYGAAHPEIANALHDLAIVRRTRGDPVGAEAAQREGLEMRLQLLEPHHPDVAGSREHLALLLRTRGAYAEAEALLMEALASLRASLGEGHARTRSVVRQLEQLYTDWQRPDQAATYRAILEAP